MSLPVLRLQFTHANRWDTINGVGNRPHTLQFAQQGKGFCRGCKLSIRIGYKA